MAYVLHRAGFTVNLFLGVKNMKCRGNSICFSTVQLLLCVHRRTQTSAMLFPFTIWPGLKVFPKLLMGWPRLNNPASVSNSRTETESCYLAYLLDALRLLSILWPFLQSFNYNNFISYLPPYFKSKQVQNWYFHDFFFSQTDSWSQRDVTAYMTITIKPEKLHILRLDIWGTASVFMVDLNAEIRGAFTNLTADYQKLRLDVGVGI